MNAVMMGKTLAEKASGAMNGFNFHVKTVFLGVMTGSLGVFYSVPSWAQTKGLGTSVQESTQELATGFSTAMKVGGAAAGLGMVAYSIYGLTLGRKKDEREYPLGSTLLVGMGGAGLLGLTAAAGLFSGSFFGGESDAVGDTFNLELLEAGN